jgi:hypothetical protein
VSDYQKAEGGETDGGGDSRRLLCAQTFIAGIAAEVENDWRKSLSGS